VDFATMGHGVDHFVPQCFRVMGLSIEAEIFRLGGYDELSAPIEY
jgi:hypothetical protein